MALFHKFESEEKTGFTYAESASYRSSVTPTRVTYMPNMSRATLIGFQSRSSEYSSPALREHKTFSSNVAERYRESRKFQQVERTKLQCGPDSDSDLELEADLSGYQLNSQQSKTIFTIMKYYTQIAKFKIFSLFSLITWYVYLSVCNVMWLDIYFLTSRPVSQFRQYFHRCWKTVLALPLLLFCIFALIAGADRFASSPLASEISAALSKLQPEAPVPIFPAAEVSTNSLAAVESLQINSQSKDIDQIEFESLKQSLYKLNEKVKILEGQLNSQRNSVPELKRKIWSLFGMARTDCCRDFPGLLEKLETEMSLRINGLMSSAQMNEEKFSRHLSEYQETQKKIADLFDIYEKLKGKQIEGSDVLASVLHKVGTLEDLSQQLKGNLGSLVSQMESGSLKSQISLKSGLSEEDVKILISAALATYDADKTGMADYALEPSGGAILNTRCTESYSYRGAVLSILGIPVWNRANNPRVVIQPGITPSQCWSFRGPEGYLVIQLSRIIVPTAFTMEHIPKSLAPDGNIDSAPKNFTVWGLNHEQDSQGVLLGNYTYDQNGSPLQTFLMEKNAGAFGIIELRIHSNHGNLNYTCLYRFRVHGKPAKN